MVAMHVVATTYTRFPHPDFLAANSSTLCSLNLCSNFRFVIPHASIFIPGSATRTPYRLPRAARIVTGIAARVAATRMTIRVVSRMV